jgi:hypothetical protein
MTVVAHARMAGWKVHFIPDQLYFAGRERIRRPLDQGDPGFPDLVLVKDGRVLVRELKSDEGRVREEQEAWLDALAAAGIDTGVWRPRDIDRVMTELWGDRIDMGRAVVDDGDSGSGCP